MSDADQPARLRIGWLILRPIIGSGGFQTIFEIINLLARFGHEQVIYMHPHGLPADYVDDPERFIRRFFGPLFASVQPWPDRIDAVDVALATEWGSFKLLDRCAPGVARAYFVQDFEPFFMPMSYEYLQAEATYRSGVPCLTIGTWLATFLHETYGAQTFPFDFAVEHATYWRQADPQAIRPRILFYARPSTPRRCFDLGIAALFLVHRRHPEAEIVFFGDKNLDDYAVPFPFHNKGILEPQGLAELYASASVGLVLSPTNPSRMPPEMMAAGCPVVDLDLAPNHYLIKHEETGLLAKPEPQAVADAVCRLLEDTALRARLVANARAYVRDLTWEHSARQVEAVLLNIGQPQPRDRDRPWLDYEHVVGEGVTPSLSASFIVGQRFVPRHDGLCRVAVALGSQCMGAPVLKLYEGVRPERPVVETRPSTTDQSWLIYDFPPLTSTKHHPLYLALSDGDGPMFRFDYRSTGRGSLAYNHVPQPGQLLFRTFYRSVLGQAAAPVDPLRDELDLLTAQQSLVKEEQQLLSEHIVFLSRHQVAPNGWSGRAAHALSLVRQGKLQVLVREGRDYLRWMVARRGAGK